MSTSNTFNLSIGARALCKRTCSEIFYVKKIILIGLVLLSSSSNINVCNRYETLQHTEYFEVVLQLYEVELIVKENNGNLIKFKHLFNDFPRLDEQYFWIPFSS